MRCARIVVQVREKMKRKQHGSVEDKEPERGKARNHRLTTRLLSNYRIQEHTVPYYECVCAEFM